MSPKCRDGEAEIQAFIERRHAQRVAAGEKSSLEMEMDEAEARYRERLVAWRAQNRADHVKELRRRAGWHFVQAELCLREARRVEMMPITDEEPRMGGIWVHPNDHDDQGPPMEAA
jgi:hypothetical protein